MASTLVRLPMLMPDLGASRLCHFTAGLARFEGPSERRFKTPETPLPLPRRERTAVIGGVDCEFPGLSHHRALDNCRDG